MAKCALHDWSLEDIDPDDLVGQQVVADVTRDASVNEDTGETRYYTHPQLQGGRRRGRRAVLLMRESRLQAECMRSAKGAGVMALNLHGSGWSNKGLPDLLLFHAGKCVAVELKSDSGYKAQPDQLVWRERFRRTGHPALHMRHEVRLRRDPREGVRKMTEIEYTYDTGDGQFFKGSMPVEVAREIAERSDSVEIEGETALVGGRYRFRRAAGRRAQGPAPRQAKGVAVGTLLGGIPGELLPVIGGCARTSGPSGPPGASARGTRACPTTRPGEPSTRPRPAWRRACTTTRASSSRTTASSESTSTGPSARTGCCRRRRPRPSGPAAATPR